MIEDDSRQGSSHDIWCTRLRSIVVRVCVLTLEGCPVVSLCRWSTQGVFMEQAHGEGGGGGVDKHDKCPLPAVEQPPCELVHPALAPSTAGPDVTARDSA